jgi:hypothetical protein
VYAFYILLSKIIGRSEFDPTLAAIKLNAARKLNWDYNKFTYRLRFTINTELSKVFLAYQVN